MNIFINLCGLLAVLPISAVLSLEWGGYVDDDVILPCTPEPNPPLEERYTIWWYKEDMYIGKYVPGDGFQPKSNKYNVTSISGHLEVYDLVQGVDDGTYECIILTASGSPVEITNHTSAVNLTVGQRLSAIDVVTNGSFIDNCYEHIGLGVITCSVLSYPEATFDWELKVADSYYCQEMIDNRNDTCWLRGDGKWNCSSSITPLSLCFGEYKCKAEFSLGENLIDRDTECIYGREYDHGSFLGWFYITLIAVLGAVLAVIVIGLIVACTCYGFTACACLSGFACFKACKKSSKEVNPDMEEIQCETLQGGQVVMGTGNGVAVNMEPPPPYAPVEEKSPYQYQ